MATDDACRDDNRKLSLKAKIKHTNMKYVFATVKVVIFPV